MARRRRKNKNFSKILKRYFVRLVKLIQTPIGITVVVGIFLIVIISILDIKYLESGSGRDILIEAHGLLFDIFVFGVLLAYLNKFLEKKQRSERYKEEIDDFRGWEEKEAKYRIVGNIKRLNKLGSTRIDLNNCYLANADLQNANLVKANLQNVDLSDADLQFADLSYANLSYANLTGADLSNALLRGANLQNAILKNSQLLRTSLWRANLNQADLSGGNLKQTNLLEADLTDVVFENTQFEKVKMDQALASEELKQVASEND
mgnify:CR=1 FL=1